MDAANLQLLDVRVFGVDVSDVGTFALIVIMVTMGLTLELKDFSKLLEAPRAVSIGLIAQLVLLPAMAFLLVWIFEPSLPIAVGLIILACCPSGATSNFFSFLAHGDVALSVVLTATSGLVVVFTAPMIIAFALDRFTGEGQQIELPIVASMLRIFYLIVLPLMVGMIIRGVAPIVALRVEPWATRSSFVLILFTMAALFAYISDNFVALLGASWKVTVTLNVVMMAVGYFAAMAMRVNEPQRRSICIEVGVQNYILSVVIAIALLQRPDFAIVPVIYLFTMYVSVFSFIGWSRYRHQRDA